MKEIVTLNNGLDIIYAGHAKSTTGCLSINVGHVNEPMLGIANLFEHVLLLQTKNITPIFGGTMTAYVANGLDYEDVFQKLSKVFEPHTVVNEAIVEKAKAEIIKKTKDAATMNARRIKLSYKHTAFSDSLVTTTEEYLAKISSYTVEDVRAFANTYYVGRNIFLSISGYNITKKERRELGEKYFGSVVEGQSAPKAKVNIYTGGFEQLDIIGTTTHLRFGWDMSKTDVNDSPVINVLMHMFKRRMQRAFADLNMPDVQVDVKIAGFYGLRTICAYISSPVYNAEELTKVFIDVVNRLCDTNASDRRMERSRSDALVEKLNTYDAPDELAIETAWQVIGRQKMYDKTNRMQEIADTIASDVRDMAARLFRGSRPTYIVGLPQGKPAHYAFDTFANAIGWKCKPEC